MGCMTSDTPRIVSRRDIEFLARLGIEAEDLEARTQLGPAAWSRQSRPEVRARIRANSARSAQRGRTATADVRTRSW